MMKPIYRTCKDCHIIIPKWKSFCVKCLREHRNAEARRYISTHKEKFIQLRKAYNADPKNIAKKKRTYIKWYKQQKELREVLYNDLINNPRKYLDRVKV